MSRLFKALGRLMPGGKKPVGYDLAGNRYFEWPSPHGDRPRRSVEYRVKKDLAEYASGERLPVQWTAWLTHTRPNPPTLEELQADEERRARLRHNIAEIEARDAAERERRKLLSAPTESADMEPLHGQEKPLPNPSTYHSVSSAAQSSPATTEQQTSRTGRETHSENYSHAHQEGLANDPNGPVDVDLRKLSQQQTDLARRRMEMQKSPLSDFTPIDPRAPKRKDGPDSGAAKDDTVAEISEESGVASAIPRPRTRGSADLRDTMPETRSPEVSDTAEAPDTVHGWAPTRARRGPGGQGPTRNFSNSAYSHLRSRFYSTCSSSEPQGDGSPIAYHLFRERLPYGLGLQLQDKIIQHRLAARKRDPDSMQAKQDIVLLLEHRPTFTTGRREIMSDASLHPEEARLRKAGAEFFVTKRGGQVTYHGPGQLVGYPILDLGRMKLSTRCYVDYLQSVLARYVQSQIQGDVLAPHPDGHVGVFTAENEKISSIGIHVRHRFTSHGFSLNVTRQPIKWFDLVLACGLTDVHAVALEEKMARADSADLTMLAVVDDLMPQLAARFNRTAQVLTARNDGELFEMIRQAEESAAVYNQQHPLPSTPTLPV